MIIEKDNQLKDFLLKNKNQDCFVIPILSDVNQHPLQNTLSAIYLKIVNGEERMLCFNHGETLKINSNKLLDLIKLGSIFVRDKKQFSHILEPKAHFLEGLVTLNYYRNKSSHLLIYSLL